MVIILSCRDISAYGEDSSVISCAVSPLADTVHLDISVLLLLELIVTVEGVYTPSLFLLISKELAVKFI
jgi:hypothetical protein